MKLRTLQSRNLMFFVFVFVFFIFAYCDRENKTLGIYRLAIFPKVGINKVRTLLVWWTCVWLVEKVAGISRPIAD